MKARCTLNSDASARSRVNAIISSPCALYAQNVPSLGLHSANSGVVVVCPFGYSFSSKFPLKSSDTSPSGVRLTG